MIRKTKKPCPEKGEKFLKNPINYETVRLHVMKTSDFGFMSHNH